jgi:hypothetical protein
MAVTLDISSKDEQIFDLNGIHAVKVSDYTSDKEGELSFIRQEKGWASQDIILPESRMMRVLVGLFHAKPFRVAVVRRGTTLRLLVDKA